MQRPICCTTGLLSPPPCSLRTTSLWPSRLPVCQQSDWLELVYSATKTGVTLGEMSSAYRPKHLFSAGVTALFGFESSVQHPAASQQPNLRCPDADHRLQALLNLTAPGMVVRLPHPSHILVPENSTPSAESSDLMSSALVKSSRCGTVPPPSASSAPSAHPLGAPVNTSRLSQIQTRAYSRAATILIPGLSDDGAPRGPDDNRANCAPDCRHAAESFEARIQWSSTASPASSEEFVRTPSFLPLNSLCLEAPASLAAPRAPEPFSRTPLWLVAPVACVETVLQRGFEMLAAQLEMPCYMLPVSDLKDPEDKVSTRTAGLVCEAVFVKRLGTGGHPDMFEHIPTARGMDRSTSSTRLQGTGNKAGQG